MISRFPAAACAGWLILILVAAAPRACAQSTFEAWQAVDVPLVQTGRLSAVIHTQLRERQRLRDFFHARAGPVLRYRWKPRINLIAGYYFGEFEVLRDQWGNNHRTFGGAETAVGMGRQTLSLRSMAEHHFGGPDVSEVRTRHQAVLTRGIGRYAFFSGGETFFDVNGFLMQRWIAGWRVPVNGRYRMDVMYYFDHRVTRAGDSRHVIQTAFRPRRTER